MERCGKLGINHSRKCCKNPPKGVVECGGLGIEARHDTHRKWRNRPDLRSAPSDLLHYKQISVKFSLISNTVECG